MMMIRMKKMSFTKPSNNKFLQLYFSATIQDLFKEEQGFLSSWSYGASKTSLQCLLLPIKTYLRK